MSEYTQDEESAGSELRRLQEGALEDKDFDTLMDFVEKASRLARAYQKHSRVQCMTDDFSDERPFSRLVKHLLSLPEYQPGDSMWLLRVRESEDKRRKAQKAKHKAEKAKRRP